MLRQTVIATNVANISRCVYCVCIACFIDNDRQILKVDFIARVLTSRKRVC
jgi:hypothetical protein